MKLMIFFALLLIAFVLWIGTAEIASAIREAAGIKKPTQSAAPEAQP